MRPIDSPLPPRHFVTTSEWESAVKSRVLVTQLFTNRLVRMKLRFSPTEIVTLSEEYESNLRTRDRRLTDAITQTVFPAYATNGFLTKNEFLTVCNWKTPRSRPRCESNDVELVREISELARTVESEQLRIEIWTLLSGVKWPTASVFLHFAFPNRYPILDFRALWSLHENVPKQYGFRFWWRYTLVCRELSHTHGVSLRVLDQALWQYSKLHQET